VVVVQNESETKLELAGDQWFPAFMRNMAKTASHEMWVLSHVRQASVVIVDILVSQCRS